jgi:hypothetical protein
VKNLQNFQEKRHEMQDLKMQERSDNLNQWVGPSESLHNMQNFCCRCKFQEQTTNFDFLEHPHENFKKIGEESLHYQKELSV